MTDLNFESVNEHIEAVDLSALELDGKIYSAVADAAAETTQAISGFCEAYQTVRPILKIISQFPFLPKKWRVVVEKFISIADLLCPQG